MLGLANGDLKLLALVEELGEYFNSEDGAIRAKGRCSILPKRAQLIQATSCCLPRRGSGLRSSKSVVFATAYVRLLCFHLDRPRAEQKSEAM